MNYEFEVKKIYPEAFIYSDFYTHYEIKSGPSDIGYHLSEERTIDEAWKSAYEFIQYKVLARLSI